MNEEYEHVEEEQLASDVLEGNILEELLENVIKKVNELNLFLRKPTITICTKPEGGYICGIIYYKEEQ